MFRGMNQKFFTAAILFFTTFCAQYESCGKTHRPLGLIKCSENVRIGDYPWLVSIHHVNQEKFICNGHIISQRHVLTSGKCLIDSLKTEIHSAVLVLVKINHFNLTDESQKQSEFIKVRQIRLSETENFVELFSFQEVAILTLEQELKFSPNIQPICLSNKIMCQEEKCSVTEVKH